MTRTVSGAVRDARPPELLVKAGNPLVRTLLRSPAGRVIGPLAVIEHHGRRTGARRRVVVAWHEHDGRRFALTPAPWRANFAGTAPASVTHRGRTQAMTGTLDTDPESVASVLRACLGAGVPARAFGLAVDADHEMTAADVTHVQRAVVWFDPA